MTNQHEAEKRDALKKAKEQFLAENPNGKKNTNDHQVSGHTEGEIRVTDATLPENPVLFIKGNKNCRFIIEASKIVKLCVVDCENVQIWQSRCTLLTGTCEVWSCQGLEYSCDTPVGTIQVDMVTAFKLSLKNSTHLGQLVIAAVDTVKVAFTEAEEAEKGFLIDWSELKQEHTLQDDDKTTQFITRFVDGKRLTEKVVRLLNDYPSTMREVKKHHSDKHATQLQIEELEAKVAATGVALSDEERLRLEEMKKSLLSNEADGEMEVSAESRALAKKAHGNDMFKEGNIPEAVAYYTQSIELFPTAPVHANRAACFLQSKHFDKALADCESCLQLEPNYVKAHFRKGLALMELQRFRDAGICFSKTLELDPKNKPARSSLAMAQMKLMKEMNGGRK